MPGSGTKLSRRKMISAPSVNQRRFLRSVALAKLARLRLAASCSACDAMMCFDPGKECGGGRMFAPAASYSDRSRPVSPQPTVGHPSTYYFDGTRRSGFRIGGLLGGGQGRALLGGGFPGGGTALDQFRSERRTSE